ncbi:hypothetical protein SAMN02745181_3249 [Rubritalea squalenifaciens DSM 18772]|uniref:DNA mimic protein DMP19 C-terminal domain-containing protein n=1 Tax=Rubritalea squalenifaciens DSM 18772 TaxID=1123071 RepID=A0A1M6PNW3_9BACT|nr:hypothetical protein [Rubritalea squalenifaciens]SHK09610.1 hypothetical protein SAMN02745181_3249 [Rubritalea squalenifaciens DSM 18772]
MIEKVEFSEEVEQLLEELEEASEERTLNREERAIVDAVDAVRAIEEGEGLHEFWQSGLDYSRILRSFDMIGCERMVDLINASQWCQTRKEDRDQYTEQESNYLDEIEEDLWDALAEVPDLVEEFIEDELS